MALVATKLYHERAHISPLAPLILMTDPDRLSDPVAAAKSLASGAAIIYRHFGKPDRQSEAERLREVTLARGQQLLIGTDPELALQVGADGVHFRRDAVLSGPMLWRKRCPDWIITMAGVKDGGSYLGDLSVLDGLFISSVFQSQSPSAGAPMGVVALKRQISRYDVPVIALGGINETTAPQLVGSGAAGLAGVSLGRGGV